jgi:hypothetical protein
VKKLGFDFSKSDFRNGKIQLAEYLSLSGKVRWGMLTNGYEFVLYDFSYETNTCVEVVHLDVRNEEEKLEINKKLVEEAAWEAMDLHEVSFKDGAWEDLSREATAFSPDSLARAILSSSVVKFISREIKGEHELKVNPEILMSRLFDLLEKGLDDAIPGWNEMKRDELSEYTRAQLRASRKVRKKAKAVAVEVGALNVASVPETVAASVVPDKKVA